MSALIFWCTVTVVIAAAITDVRTRRIPNWLVVPFFLLGLAVHIGQRGVAGLWESLAGLAITALVTGLLYQLGGLGMGDCKLLAAVGLWVGPDQALFVLIGTALAGGLLAIAYAMWHGVLFRSVASTAEVMVTVVRSGLRAHPTAHLDNPSALAVPYGLAIAAGTIFSFYTQ